MHDDRYWLQQALDLAKRAEQVGEVPIGAVVTYQNKLLAEGYNQVIQAHDPTAHAEIVALRAAAKKQGNYRLLDTTLYVTLEPCIMCAGAIIHARVKRVVFGAYDPKAGAVSSVFSILGGKQLNHYVICQGGVLEASCSDRLKKFFQAKR